MNRAINSRLARWTLLLAPAVVALGGCGSGSVTTRSNFTATTPGGLSYAQETTVQGKQSCTTTTIRAALPNGQPGVNTSHSCGPASIGHPLLVQAKSSPESILVDSPTTTCGLVRAGPTHQALHAIRTQCSTGQPLTRATILPSAKRVVLVGVPKVPVINFPRHPCRIICVTALA
jgi:hypothetical protein